MQELAVAGKYKYFSPLALAVGNTATALPAPVPTAGSGNVPVPPAVILLQAPTSNSNSVFVGNAAVSLIAGSMELTPGQSFELPTRDYTQWYAICVDGVQSLTVVYLNGEL